MGNARLGPPPALAPGSAFGHAAPSDDRRRLILHTAAVLFEAKGFYGTSMQDIADRVGITKASIYHYVKTKEELLYAIHDAYIVTVVQEAQEYCAAHPDPRDQLRFFVRQIMRLIVEYRPYVRTFFQESNLLDDERLRHKRDMYESLVETCFTNGEQAGFFTFHGARKPAMLFFFGACNWAYQWLDPEGPVDIDALSEQWIALLLHGLAGPSLPAHGP